ncbi:MAG: hypothetical protein BA872_07990 [Desulfobacterales bacterium C00003060]|nr:MAG: hypothetical protein BA861_09460 [Desulfobacterales bacterium S3730MH5]OEU79250.1 MAG: hypothetical protein BA865_04710 [Desulfobacterales bacterium S5133MH4]OEU80263.1 MAG: hypothetical protein BA872_07990 [Desulfobacterales bacterium C00003060]
MLEMGVHTTKASKTFPAGSVFLKIRDHDRLVVANYYMRYPALAVDKDTDLTADLKGDPANGLGEVRRNNKGRGCSATVEIVQPADLVCLEPARLSINLDKQILIVRVRQTVEPVNSYRYFIIL